MPNNYFHEDNIMHILTSTTARVHFSHMVTLHVILDTQKKSFRNGADGYYDGIIYNK